MSMPVIVVAMLMAPMPVAAVIVASVASVSFGERHWREHQGSHHGSDERKSV